MENGIGTVKVESGFEQAKIHQKMKTVAITCLLQRKKRKLGWRLRREKWKQFWNKEKDIKKKERERKEKMAKPIDPLPERELCQYEKIRENIIKERKEAMARYNFFENLKDTKRDIGLYKEDNPKKNKKGKNVKEKNRALDDMDK
jgi:hypothetical protein